MFISSNVLFWNSKGKITSNFHTKSETCWHLLGNFHKARQFDLKYLYLLLLEPTQQNWFLSECQIHYFTQVFNAIWTIELFQVRNEVVLKAWTVLIQGGKQLLGLFQANVLVKQDYLLHYVYSGTDEIVLFGRTKVSFHMTRFSMLKEKQELSKRLKQQCEWKCKTI